MNEYERVVHRLRINRDSLLRRVAEYHRARLHLQCAIKPGAALDSALATLNRRYPDDYCAAELVAINAKIEKATAEVHRSKARSLREGEHLDTRRTNLGRR